MRIFVFPTIKQSQKLYYLRLCTDFNQGMVLIFHCLLYNLNFNHCQQTTVKLICWLIKVIIQVFWHDDVQDKCCWISTSQANKSCQHFYFDAMTNLKCQDKYYWISTSQDNKSWQLFYDVMTNFKRQEYKVLVTINIYQGESTEAFLLLASWQIPIVCWL